jgi:uncharacterized protein
VTTLYWDFFGGAAEGTARHFQKHLDEFLARNACEGATTGLESNADGHRSVFCRAPAEQAEAIARALKPRRTASEETSGP